MKHDYNPFELEELDQNEQEQSAEQKAAIKQEVDDFLYVMRSKEGRRFMWRLLTWTHVFRSSFGGNSSETVFREGERNIGCRLIDLIHTNCYELYGTMIREQKHDDRNDSGSGSK